MKMFRHIIDIKGQRWLVDENNNYFNGVSWVTLEAEIIVALELEETTIPKFLEELASLMNYEN